MASPLLPAGATTGDSGGELSSGDDSGDVESLPSPELEASRSLAELFEKAAAHLQGLMQVASREQLLYLYARYKQVKSPGRGGCGRATRGLFPPKTVDQRAWLMARCNEVGVCFGFSSSAENRHHSGPGEDLSAVLGGMFSWTLNDSFSLSSLTCSVTLHLCFYQLQHLYKMRMIT